MPCWYGDRSEFPQETAVPRTLLSVSSSSLRAPRPQHATTTLAAYPHEKVKTDRTAQYQYSLIVAPAKIPSQRADLMGGGWCKLRVLPPVPFVLCVLFVLFVLLACGA